MKRITLIIGAILLTFSAVTAQNVDDALRYSQIFYNGTARFMSMGGAFTALGGDMSVLSQNPAGLGVFRSSEISFTPQLFHAGTTSNFHGMADDYLYNFNIGQAGIVSNLISNNNQTGLVTLNVGYSFNKTNNLNSTIRIEGINNTSSMADSWADQGFGTHYTELSGAPGIAYDAWIIDTLTGAGQIDYGTVFSNYGDDPEGSLYGQNMRRLINNQGYTGEHAISIGGNVSNKIFFGATLGINRIKYTSHYEHQERADYDLPSLFRDFTYLEHYENSGTGVSLKIGAIFKPVENLRIGIGFHSPTYYKINEYYYDNINSSFTDGESYEYENDPMRYSYALTTPFRVLAGAALQVKKVALLSADYEFIDYTAAKFSETGDNYDYSEKNLAIRGTLRPAHNIRLGGEFRMNKVYFRGGYGYYGKVFKSGEENDQMDHNSISFGLGFREQNLNIDFGYMNIKNPQRYVLYNTFSESAISNLSTGKNIFAVTVGYKFGY